MISSCRAHGCHYAERLVFCRLCRRAAGNLRRWQSPIAASAYALVVHFVWTLGRANAHAFGNLLAENVWSRFRTNGRSDSFGGRAHFADAAATKLSDICESLKSVAEGVAEKSSSASVRGRPRTLVLTSKINNNLSFSVFRSPL